MPAANLIRLLHDLPISMLVATHDLAMVQEICPRMVVMDGGRLLAMIVPKLFCGMKVCCINMDLNPCRACKSKTGFPFFYL